MHRIVVFLTVICFIGCEALFGGKSSEEKKKGNDKEYKAAFGNSGAFCYWGSLGCYENPQGRMLPNLAQIPKDKLNAETCINKCSTEFGATLIGLQDGDKCYCGNGYGIAPQPSSKCTIKCGTWLSKLNPLSWFNSKGCGGKGAISMHACGTEPSSNKAPVKTANGPGR